MTFKASEKPKVFDPNLPSVIVVKSGNTILVDNASNKMWFESSALALEPTDLAKLIYIGQLDEKEVYALERNHLVSSNREYKLVYSLMDALPTDELSAFFRSAQLLNWDKISQFCGCCGNATQLSDKEFTKSCNQCGHKSYPQYSPAIVVMVMHETKLLLGRSPHFRPGMFSPLAGFIEAGESAVDAVHRELMEEVGIKVNNVRSFDSAPWPFPNSLMLGFLADYESGDLTPDPKEIEAAAWFEHTNLPILPIRSSLSHQLVQAGVRLCQEKATRINAASAVSLVTRPSCVNQSLFRPSNATTLTMVKFIKKGIL